MDWITVIGIVLGAVIIAPPVLKMMFWWFDKWFDW